MSGSAANRGARQGAAGNRAALKTVRELVVERAEIMSNYARLFRGNQAGEPDHAQRLGYTEKAAKEIAEASAESAAQAAKVAECVQFARQTRETISGIEQVWRAQESDPDDEVTSSTKAAVMALLKRLIGDPDALAILRSYVPELEPSIKEVLRETKRKHDNAGAMKSDPGTLDRALARLESSPGPAASPATDQKVLARLETAEKDLRSALQAKSEADEKISKLAESVRTRHRKTIEYQTQRNESRKAQEEAKETSNRLAERLREAKETGSKNLDELEATRSELGKANDTVDELRHELSAAKQKIAEVTDDLADSKSRLQRKIGLHDQVVLERSNLQTEHLRVLEQCKQTSDELSRSEKACRDLTSERRASNHQIDTLKRDLAELEIRERHGAETQAAELSKSEKQGKELEKRVEGLQRELANSTAGKQDQARQLREVRSELSDARRSLAKGSETEAILDQERAQARGERDVARREQDFLMLIGHVDASAIRPLRDLFDGEDLDRRILRAQPVPSGHTEWSANPAWIGVERLEDALSACVQVSASLGNLPPSHLNDQHTKVTGQVSALAQMLQIRERIPAALVHCVERSIFAASEQQLSMGVALSAMRLLVITRSRWPLSDGHTVEQAKEQFLRGATRYLRSPDCDLLTAIGTGAAVEPLALFGNMACRCPLESQFVLGFPHLKLLLHLDLTARTWRWVTPDHLDFEKFARNEELLVAPQGDEENIAFRCPTENSEFMALLIETNT